MAVYGKNKHYKWSRIRKEHWMRTGELCGVSKQEIREVIEELTETVPSAIDLIEGKLPPEFPSSVAEQIFDGFGTAVSLLK